ncbi:MAG: carbohydrate-binding protein [Clostridium sp.]|nr:carbohydrate-binding protein [Clostridium sp.]
MKFSKKFLSLLTCFIFLTVGFIFNPLSTTKVKAADLPIQLYYATNSYSGAVGYVNGFVCVKNLSCTKKVTIHYSYDNTNQWKDISATYLKTNTDGYEVWQFQIPSNYSDNCKFCIKCEANGQTYWDNNSGNNYSVGLYKTVLGKSKLCITNSWINFGRSQSNVLGGNITLSNIGNPKVVKVRYSEDGGVTYKESNANYDLSSDDKSLDYWSFSIQLNSSTHKVQFSVCYEVNGIEYWDNNFGSNYTLIS